MTLTAKGSTTARYSTGAAARGDGNTEPGFVPGTPHARLMAAVPYEFAVDGTPLFSTLAGMGMGVYFPANSLVTCTWTQVITAIVGPTNLYQTLEVDADLLVSGSVAANEFDVAGDVVVGSVAAILSQTAKETTGASPFTSATRVLTTVQREFIFGCTVAAISAGKFVTYVEYVVIA